MFGNASRPKTALNAVGNQTSYAYVFTHMGGPAGFLSQITDARGNPTTISYQAIGTGRTAIYPHRHPVADRPSTSIVTTPRISSRP